MPINIKSIEIQNFKSFGDYVTKIDLANLGPVLIVGECEESHKIKASRSNGAGKSSLISAIIWVLWGRTHDKAKPGDSVINWATKKNCYVRLDTTDGYTIIRTRKLNGKDELIFYKDNKDQTRSTNSNAQTAINKIFGLDYDIFSSAVFLEQRAKPILELQPKQRQIVIERMLQLHKLHYRAEVSKELLKKYEADRVNVVKEIDIHRSNVDRLKLELKTQEAQQKEFEQSRINSIIEVENRITQFKKELKQILVPDIDDLESKWKLIIQIEEKLATLTTQKHEIDINISNLKTNILTNKENLSELQLKLKNREDIDIQNIEDCWNIYNKDIDNVKKLQKEHQILLTNLENLNFKIKEKSKYIDTWRSKAGSACPSCMQEISEVHTEHLAKPILDELSEMIKQRQKLESDISKLGKQISNAEATAATHKPNISLELARSNFNETVDIKNRIQTITNKISKFENDVLETQKKALTISNAISKINIAMDGKRPEMTLVEAKSIIRHSQSVSTSIELLEKERERLSNGQNPHVRSIDRLNDNITVDNSKIDNLREQLNSIDIYIKHYDYIKKAYSDRNKIKGLILNGIIPIINKRLRYYLDKFGFEVAELKFDNLLEMVSSKWDYTACSGGERQCLDLALMFALFDTNSIQYGRHSNIMILDEVDGRLDSNYVEKLASVIVDDLGKQSVVQPSTILVVSHKNDMFDAFPTKIIVRKRNGFSYVDIEK